LKKISQLIPSPLLAFIVKILEIQSKIKKYRASLDAERTRFGCHDDNGGRRYKTLELSISIDDYQVELIYLRSFFKNFPDDAGFPFFWYNPA
jgi:hypothetical protein